MKLLVLVAVLVVASSVQAQVGTQTFSENFESFTVNAFGQTLPDQSWYNYHEAENIGTVATTAPTIGGAKSFHVESPLGLPVTDKFADFDLEQAASLTSIDFRVKGSTIPANGNGSNQYVSLQSATPRRTIAEFYVFCDDASFPNGCEFRVRFDQADTIGQVLINSSMNLTEFRVQLAFDWFNAQYSLTVNGVPDGVFPFMELPSNFQRLRLAQYEATTPIDLAFDNWTVVGAFDGFADSGTGDAATGIRNFLTNIKFTTAGSLFAFGIVLLVVILAGVVVPLLVLGRDNSVTPAVSFLGVLTILWLVRMEILPEWVGIAIIIIAAAIVSFAVRSAILGIRDASQGPGLVAGSLGYFIIAATLLAFSGYAGADILLPTADLEIDDGASELPENETISQGFVEQVLDCSVGIITFGKFGDCERDSRGSAITWAKDTVDNIGRITAAIFSYAKTATIYLFQLLTFQLPIPVLFNMMIVLPPAAALATLAVQTIRGTG